MTRRRWSRVSLLTLCEVDFQFRFLFPFGDQHRLKYRPHTLGSDIQTNKLLWLRFWKLTCQSGAFIWTISPLTYLSTLIHATIFDRQVHLLFIPYLIANLLGL